jgi:hypothetical protein
VPVFPLRLLLQVPVSISRNNTTTPRHSTRTKNIGKTAPQKWEDEWEWSQDEEEDEAQGVVRLERHTSKTSKVEELERQLEASHSIIAQVSRATAFLTCLQGAALLYKGAKGGGRSNTPKFNGSSDTFAIARARVSTPQGTVNNNDNNNSYRFRIPHKVCLPGSRSKTLHPFCSSTPKQPTHAVPCCSFPPHPSRQMKASMSEAEAALAFERAERAALAASHVSLIVEHARVASLAACCAKRQRALDRRNRALEARCDETTTQQAEQGKSGQGEAENVGGTPVKGRVPLAEITVPGEQAVVVVGPAVEAVAAKVAGLEEGNRRVRRQRAAYKQVGRGCGQH